MTGRLPGWAIGRVRGRATSRKRGRKPGRWYPRCHTRASLARPFTYRLYPRVGIAVVIGVIPPNLAMIIRVTRVINALSRGAGRGLRREISREISRLARRGRCARAARLTAGRTLNPGVGLAVPVTRISPTATLACRVLIHARRYARTA